MKEQGIMGSLDDVTEARKRPERREGEEGSE